MKYLNQFLPPDHYMRYIHIDMARINKRQEERGITEEGVERKRGGGGREAWMEREGKEE